MSSSGRISRGTAVLTVPLLIWLSVLVPSAAASPAGASVVDPVVGPAVDPGVGSVPQGVQSDATYAGSYATAHVTNVSATTSQVSCYRPEVPYSGDLAPTDGYSGESACPGATTGEDTGATAPYPTQAGSNAGSPAAGPMLVKDHSESDIRVDPTNPAHLIGQSKWIVSAEGYNHLLGFYESFNGGRNWTVSGHVPGYEGWTDNTDPVGAFDGYGNFYSLNLPYEFYYNSDGSHDYKIGTPLEPNPVVAAEAIAMSVRPHGSTAANQWITTHNGKPDYVASYDSVGNEPDKQWLTIDENPASPHYNRIYAMWVDFHHTTPVPFVSYADARPDGTHTDWSTPQALPEPPHTPTGATYLLPHVAPDGTVYTTLTGFNPKQHYCCATISVDSSSDGGTTWSVAGTVADNIAPPPAMYANTTFRDGIENTFTLGAVKVNGHYPLYAAWEDYSAAVANVLLSASYDGGSTWSTPIQVNDNAAAVDEFQPNLTTAPDGTVSVAFYDRRLACAASGTSEAKAAGLALDTSNPNYSGTLPPYGATNYCVNTSIQFYQRTLAPIGHNIRISQFGFDPQLNSPHAEAISTSTTFLGDYFGNTVASTAAGPVDITTSVSTYDDGANPANRQQQIVATVAVP